MMSLDEAKAVLRMDADNYDNDALILSLLQAIPDYIELQTGMKPEDQISEPLADTVSGFILTLWYFAERADDQKLNRTITSLLKCIALKANSYNRANQE